MLKLICLLLSSSLALAQTGAGIQKAQQFVDQLTSVQAVFVQTVFDQEMNQLETSSGKVYLQKPGKFRWDYLKPYQQTVVSNGKTLWLYDPELEQVTERTLQGGLGTTPLALLTQSVQLTDEFDIEELGQVNERDTLQLASKTQDTNYENIILAFGDDGLEVMELKDALGQVTRIELFKIQQGKVRAELFDFIPPEGTDVLAESS